MSHKKWLLEEGKIYICNVFWRDERIALVQPVSEKRQGSASFVFFHSKVKLIVPHVEDGMNSINKCPFLYLKNGIIISGTNLISFRGVVAVTLDR